MGKDSPVPGKREQNKRDKLNRITLAALKLFHRQGFDRTTTAQIAAEAKVAEGTLFLYVARKEDLLILAFTSETADVVRRAQEGLSNNGDLLSQLLEFFDTLFSNHLQNPALARAYLREVGFLRDPDRDYGFGRIPMLSSIGAVIDRGKARGEVARSHDTADIAVLTFSVYWYCLRDWANDMAEPDVFRSTLRRLLTLQVAGLRP